MIEWFRCPNKGAVTGVRPVAAALSNGVHNAAGANINASRRSSGEARAGRDRNCHRLQSQICDEIYRSAHGVSAGEIGVIGKCWRDGGPKIMTFGIRYSRAAVAANCRLDGRAACSFFYCVVQATDQEEGHVKIKSADNQPDEYRSNECVFDSGRTEIVAPYRDDSNFWHVQSNRIHAVLVIGVANVSAMVTPGKSGL
jgi:hypothetical protein